MVAIGPAWLREALAAVMIAAALYHAARLVLSRRRRPEYDLTHLAMGIAMAVMLSATLSSRWALVFAVPTIWFAWRGLQQFVVDGARALPRPAAQSVACGATVYMLVAMVPAHAATMPGMQMPEAGGSPPAPVLAATFAAAMVAVTVWQAIRLRHAALARRTSASSGPALAIGCQFAMSATMVYMLAALL